MRLFFLGSLLVGATLASLATTADAADVHVTIADGKVSVSAKDATIGQILKEWARVGQTRIVNMDRLPGAPLTLELTNVPESQALDTLLRSASGYLAAPRAVALPNASAYDRIFVLATSSGTPARAVAAPPAQGGFGPPVFQQQPVDDDDRDQDAARQGMPLPRPVPGPPNAPLRGGANFAQPPIQRQPSPMPTQGTPVQPPPSLFGTPAAPTPAGPVGVPTPGMVVPTPQQQPGQPRLDNP
jgi:hypothetical protein